MVKYRLITTYRNFEDVKEILNYYKLKWEIFSFGGWKYFVFRCGDKIYKDILTLAKTDTDAIGIAGGLPKAPGKKHHQVKKNKAFHYA